MNALMKKAGMAVALGAVVLATAAPAEAQRYRGYRHGGRGDAGVALAAGIAGLAIGAAIASNNNDRYYRDRYYVDYGYPVDYDRVYYRSHGYYPHDGYYAYRYRDAYPRCFTEWRWDPYYRDRVRIRVCR